jgi:hypothetical protein
MILPTTGTTTSLKFKKTDEMDDDPLLYIGQKSTTVPRMKAKAYE